MIATATEVDYFIETYQTLHISRAAIRLGVSQPTLTQSLQKLEEKLNAKLFFRTKQGVVPTREGTLFYSKAQTLLEHWKDLNNGVRDSRRELRGRFRIGCHPSVGSYALPPLLKNLEASAPAIEIDLVHDFSRKITEGIVSYQIDLGYVINPVKHPDLVLKKLGVDRVMFWKKKGAARVPKRLLADASLSQIDELLGKAYKKSFRDWSLVQSNSLELIRTLTLSGHGVGILPERVAKAAGEKELIPYDKALPAHGDEIYLAYRKEALSSYAGRELVRLASFQL